MRPVITLLFCLFCASLGDASTRVSSTPPSSFSSASSSIPSPFGDDENEVSLNSICTAAAHLATDFQKALVEVNQQREDIHVGHLLSACEGLEAAMRRIGFVQSASDINTNLSKIRTVYNQVSPDKRDSMPALLQYEMNETQSSTKTLRDSSATHGLLWLGRSLNYQFDMFQQLLLDGNIQPYEAACCAYERNMKPHLSWAFQKVCQVGLKQLKGFPREHMLAGIGGFAHDCYGACEDEATKNDLLRVIRCLEPMLGRWRQVFSEMGLGEI